jgi:hypothetical protein
VSFVKIEFVLFAEICLGLLTWAGREALKAKQEKCLDQISKAYKDVCGKGAIKASFCFCFVFVFLFIISLSLNPLSFVFGLRP